jgi:hypothetical protein
MPVYFPRLLSIHALNSGQLENIAGYSSPSTVLIVALIKALSLPSFFVHIFVNDFTANNVNNDDHPQEEQTNNDRDKYNN